MSSVSATKPVGNYIKAEEIKFSFNSLGSSETPREDNRDYKPPEDPQEIRNREKHERQEQEAAAKNKQPGKLVCDDPSIGMPPN